MSFDNYRLADCNLFLLPPIDTSKYEDKIEHMIFEAWKGGSNASSAVNSILSNAAILDELASQVEENLAYQAEVTINNAEDERARKEAAAIAERDASLESTVQEYAPVIEEKEQAAQAAELEKEKVASSYSASQQRLDEMRARIKDRLDYLGGDKGISMLDHVSSQISTSSSQGYQGKNYSNQKFPGFLPDPQEEGISYGRKKISPKQDPLGLSYDGEIPRDRVRSSTNVQSTYQEPDLSSKLGSVKDILNTGDQSIDDIVSEAQGTKTEIVPWHQKNIIFRAAYGLYWGLNPMNWVRYFKSRGDKDDK